MPINIISSKVTISYQTLSTMLLQQVLHRFELTAQLKYLWPNLRLNSMSNPLFNTIQIDLYDPLRIQHESLPH
eukprot:jgi/Chrzof1/2463/Cz11g16200.t1